MSFAALSGGVSGAAAGAQQVGQNIRDKRTSDIAVAEEGREAEKHGWAKAFGDIFNARQAVDQPPAPPPEATPGAIPAGAGQPPPAAAAPGAIPAAGGAPPPAAGGAPPPAAARPSRRERYNEWFDKGKRLSLLTGGLEGLSKFEEMENATSRRQVMGYGLQAARAMDEGNVGEAMRAGNAALETTPFDTGLKFEAIGGKLHMVGEDGKPGAPLGANELRAFVEDNMKTPEQYLDWKAQYEVERGALVKEGIAAKNAESTRRQADQYVTEGPGRDLLRKAQAYAALASGEAALMKAGAAGEDGGLAWTEENMLKIEEMEQTALDGGLGFGGAWIAEGARNSQLNSDAISAAVETRIANAPDAMTHNDASTISRMAYFNELVDEDGVMVTPDSTMLDLLSNTKVFTDDKGNFMVDYKGKSLLVPPHVGSRINLNKQQAPAE